MGRRKFRLGRIPKNYEKQKRLGPVGRPRKRQQRTKLPKTKDTQCASASEVQNDSELVTSPVHENICLPSSNWSIHRDDVGTDTRAVRFCKISTASTCHISHCLSVNSDSSWKLTVHGQQVSHKNCTLLSSFPAKLTHEQLQRLLNILERSIVCPGNPDEKFVELIKAKKGKIMNANGKSVAAALDCAGEVCISGQHYSETVRTSTCELLTTSPRCGQCVAYRNTLRSLHHKFVKHQTISPSRHTNVSSHTNYRYLNTPQKQTRMKVLKQTLDSAKQKIAYLQEQIKQSIDKNGVLLDEQLNSDLSDIMKQNNDSISEQFPSDSFQRLFWEQQIQAVKAKKTGIRWHPMIIRWCLNLKLLSTSAYRSMRSAGFINLPSERTLRDYSHYIESAEGFQNEVEDQLRKEAKYDSLEESQKFVVLALDEMKIKEGLVYDKYGCRVVGFVNLGETMNQMMDFERNCSEGKSELPVAKQMLVLMVRGLFFNLNFPYAQFTTKGITAEYLFPLVWTAIRRLEGLGFKVIAVTCDGAKPNQKFFQMHQAAESPIPGTKIVYRSVNPFAKEKRFIYFFSDVPHLMETLRNCWSHSFAHNHTRCLWRCGKHISWEHLRQLHRKVSASSGLSMLPKIKTDHLQLNSYSRMRVDLAAQILSSSVANAFSYFKDESTSETELFVRMCDKFFDLLNVRCFSEGKKRRKPELDPYNHPADKRLKWLKEDFLSYLNEWERSVKGREKFKAAEKQKMMLSQETIQGLKITVHSFVEVAQYLLGLPGRRSLLSERFSQDPLESFFGQQRARGGRNENPTAQQFLDNTVSLRIQRSLALEPVRGNCRKRPNRSNPEIDPTPLPKRRKLKMK